MFVSVQQFGLIGIMYCSQVEPRVGKAASGGRLNTLHLEEDRVRALFGHWWSHGGSDGKTGFSDLK